MTPYEAYLQLYQEVGAMQNKLKETALEIIKQMGDESIEKIQGTAGTITCAKRKTYTYSDELQAKEKELQDDARTILEPIKNLKKGEEDMGTAKVETKEYLRVTLKPLI